MKNTGKCPKCESMELVHFYEVPEKADAGFLTDADSNMNLGTKQGLIFRKGGELESYACKKCGYVEFYVKNVEELKNVDPALGEDVIGFYNPDEDKSTN